MRSVVGLLTTLVGSDGHLDDRIKFFETTNPPILTTWFVDLQRPQVISKLSQKTLLLLMCEAFYGMIVCQQKSLQDIWRIGKGVICEEMHQSWKLLGSDLTSHPALHAAFLK